MLTSLLDAAISSAAVMSGMSSPEAEEFSGRRPRHSAFSRLLNRRKPSTPQVIPGAKPAVAQLFSWLRGGHLTVTPGEVRIEIAALKCLFLPGQSTLQQLEKLLGRNFNGQKYDAAISGQVISIGENRTLKLPSSAPFPALQLVDSSILARWSPAAKVSQGRFTAELNSISIYEDRGEVDVSWKLLGFDMAKNPVVWWGD